LLEENVLVGLLRLDHVELLRSRLQASGYRLQGFVSKPWGEKWVIHKEAVHARRPASNT
jgi:hypothetical protein